MKKEIKKKVITYATIGAITATGLGVGVKAANDHFGYEKYIVKPGDTLSEICEDRYDDYTLYEIVARRNHINPDDIYPGQEIYLPHRIQGTRINCGKEYTIKPGDTLYDICIREYNDESLAAKLAFYNGNRDADIIRAGDTIMIPPYEVLINVELPRTMRIK